MNLLEAKPIEKAFATADARPEPKTRTREVVIGRVEEIPIGDKKIVEVEGISIGIFHLQTGFHAIRNYCPHQGAQLCRGSVHGTHRPASVSQFDPALEGRVLRCPWHGWEFDIVSGKGLYDARSRVTTYEVRVGENGELVLMM